MVLFWVIYGAVFIDNMCWYSYLFFFKNACPYFTYISDFMDISTLQYSQSFFTSACTLEGNSKKPLKFAVNLVTTKKETFWVILDICMLHVLNG